MMQPVYEAVGKDAKPDKYHYVAVAGNTPEAVAKNRTYVASLGYKKVAKGKDVRFAGIPTTIDSLEVWQIPIADFEKLVDAKRASTAAALAACGLPPDGDCRSDVLKARDAEERARRRKEMAAADAEVAARTKAGKGCKR